ncbi:FadR/GntR family transcriptional regulator [Actinomycetospora straminea]|uniref:GntR family transcriptional regulator n=1 Tax=Actinomycetospora straminea TaxID=663607 RepID=A0ABP9EX52_9PSEU|nr:FCD domain-containing protein [Actinomycetospora straminea]MDD7931854.1 FCD domain-containing protein [Actinomycetospora straminea]
MARQVSSTTLAQAVADHLRMRIHRGDVSPGERLPAERELAEQLGVARISLREAIRQLREDGYVEVRRGSTGGTYVTELHRPAEAWRARMRAQAGEMDDIIDFRIALETETAALAARRHTAVGLAPVREAVLALHDVIGRTAFRQADSRFHVALARAAGNERLEEAVESARGELFSPRDLLPFREPVEETLRDHQAIYEAVAAGDAAAASAAMRAHLEGTRRQLRIIVFGAEDGADEVAWSPV